MKLDDLKIIVCLREQLQYLYSPRCHVSFPTIVKLFQYDFDEEIIGSWAHALYNVIEHYHLYDLYTQADCSTNTCTVTINNILVNL